MRGSWVLLDANDRCSDGNYDGLTPQNVNMYVAWQDVQQRTDLSKRKYACFQRTETKQSIERVSSMPHKSRRKDLKVQEYQETCHLWRITLYFKLNQARSESATGNKFCGATAGVLGALGTGT